jgi:hypothetical protein
MLSRIITPGAGLVLSIATLLVGTGLGAADALTHEQGLAMAALGALGAFILVLWAVFAPYPPKRNLDRAPLGHLSIRTGPADDFSFKSDFQTRQQTANIAGADVGTIGIPLETEAILDALDQIRSEANRPGLFTPTHFLRQDGD